MKKMIFYVLVALCFGPCLAQSADWNLQIIPVGSYEKIGNFIELVDDDSCFYVVLTNTSKTPLNVWEEWSSWGYFCLSFSIKLSDGKVYEIRKQGRSWNKNFPSPYYVYPNHSFVLPVTFNPDIWQGFPKKWKDQTVLITAKYQIKDGDSDVWNGTVTSEPISTRLYIKDRIQPHPLFRRKTPGMTGYLAVLEEEKATKETMIKTLNDFMSLTPAEQKEELERQKGILKIISDRIKVEEQATQTKP